MRATRERSGSRPWIENASDLADGPLMAHQLLRLPTVCVAAPDARLGPVGVGAQRRRDRAHLLGASIRRHEHRLHLRPRRPARVPISSELHFEFVRRIAHGARLERHALEACSCGALTRPDPGCARLLAALRAAIPTPAGERALPCGARCSSAVYTVPRARPRTIRSALSRVSARSFSLSRPRTAIDVRGLRTSRSRWRSTKRQ